MSTDTDKETVDLRPWWVQLCGRLGPGLGYIWGPVLLGGVVVTFLSALLNHGPSSFAWVTLKQYRPIVLIIVIVASVLIVLTVVVGVGNLVGRLRYTTVPGTLEQRYGARFRAYLKTRYTDSLKRSLQGAACMALELANQTDAILQTPCLRTWSPSTSGCPSPVSTSIVEAYQDANGELLILGEPGAGKTTLLLNLAQELLASTEQDEQQIFPVIFDLSSWAVNKPKLSDWLIQELKRSYGWSRLLSQKWIQNEQILPLLDGFDEVAFSAREACIKAINDYLNDYHRSPLVVCSRKSEYRALQEHLSLEHAVVVQPLSQQQVKDYLLAAGKPLAALRSVLHKNPVLYELAMTPLMLNVMTLAYRDMPARSLPRMGTLQQQQRQVFTSYVQRMVEPRERIPSRYTPQQIKKGLVWLATKLRQQNQTVFYLEQLQPSWLTNRQLQSYLWLGVRLPGILLGVFLCFIMVLFFYPDPVSVGLTIPTISLLGGVIGGLLTLESTSQPSTKGNNTATHRVWHRLVGTLTTGGILGLGFGLGYNHLKLGLIFGLCGCVLYVLLPLFSNVSRSPPDSKNSTRRRGWQYLIYNKSVQRGMLIGLLIGLSYGLAFMLVLEGDQTKGLTPGLTTSLCFGLVGGLLSRFLAGRPISIQPTDRIVWSWKSLRGSLFSKEHLNQSFSIAILISVLAGLSDWPRTGSLYGPIVGLFLALIIGLFLGLLLGVIYWILLGLFQSVSRETISDQDRSTPNQGIHSSARNGFQFGLVGGVICVVISIMYYTTLDYREPIMALQRGLQIGLISFIELALLAGGLAWLRHWILRLILWQARSIPLNYPRFLREADRRILLREEGSGYRFIHRLFLDYFADLDTTGSSTPSPQVSE
ncbi:hypothetical protein ccbrp13_70080 [Ktedonobacteria bacterium brp13]|nr:hypothetical protein ccbrp13_70080 [Ktedonobacteria bacterium brp13]